MNTEQYQLGKELDSFNHQQVQNEILAILENGSSVVIDMSACHFQCWSARVALFQESGSLEGAEDMPVRNQ